VLLLENTRFHKGEEAGDVEFARQLAVGYDIYVNDAFGTAHRSHASVDHVAKCMPVCVPGFVMEKELQFLQVQTVKPASCSTVTVPASQGSREFVVYISEQATRCRVSQADRAVKRRCRRARS